MKKCSTVFAVIALTLLMGPPHSYANLVFDWTGTCVSVCTGQATFHAITTDEYVPGSIQGPSTIPILLEALYTDSQISVDMAPAFQRDGNAFQFPGSLLIEQLSFITLPSGTWGAGGEDLAPGCDPANPLPPNLPNCSYRASGVSGTWAPVTHVVPWPSTLVLLGVGLGRMAFHRRRGPRT